MTARIALLALAAVVLYGCAAPAASPSASARSSAASSTSAAPSTSAAASAEPAASAEASANAVVAGDLLRVQNPGLRMRSEPATDAEIVRELAEGAVVSVLGGPTAGEGHDWYEVSHGGLAGWVASGEAHDWLAVIRNGRIGFACVGCTDDRLGALMTVEADGTDARVIWDEYASPAWSPDGSQLAVSYQPAFDVPQAIVLLSPSGEIERELGTGYGPAWSPDGHRLAFLNTDERTIELVEGEDQVGVIVTDHGTPTSLQWSPDSVLLAFVGIDCPECPIGEPIAGEPPMAVSTFQPPGGAITRLADGGNAGIRHWSADGSVITFVENDQSIPAIEVWEVDVDSGVATVLPIAGGSVGAYGYAISPDESRVAYGTFDGIVVTDRDLGNGVMVAHRDGALMPTNPRWSPDGRWILYDIIATQGDAIYPAVVRSDGTEGWQLVDHDGYNAAWQPRLEALP